MLLPLSLTAAAPLGHRSGATVARCRRPSRPGHPEPPPPELRPGIDLAGSPLPFPSLPAAAEPSLFFLFAKQTLYHLNLFINRTPTFSRVTQTFPEVLNKSFH